MYLRNLRDSLRRRWYLVVAGLIIVTGLGTLTYLEVPPTYEASASVVLLPPDSAVPEGGNPYLYLGGLGQALDVLTRAIDADTTREALLGTDDSLDYTAAPDSTTAGPILLIEASGPTKATTLGVLNAVLDAVPATLGQLQDDLKVAPTAQILSSTLTVDEKATPVGKTRLRILIAVVVGVSAVLLLLIGAIDGLLLRLRPAGHKAPARRGLRGLRRPGAEPDALADEAGTVEDEDEEFPDGEFDPSELDEAVLAEVEDAAPSASAAVRPDGIRDASAEEPDDDEELTSSEHELVSGKAVK